MFMIPTPNKLPSYYYRIPMELLLRTREIIQKHTKRPTFNGNLMFNYSSTKVYEQ